MSGTTSGVWLARRGCIPGLPAVLMSWPCSGIAGGRQSGCTPSQRTGLPNTALVSRSASPSRAAVVRQVGGEARPARIRVLDLPFTAVEWVLPQGAAPRDPPGADRWLTLERSPLARERSFFGAWDLDGSDAAPEGAPAAASL